jgi:hypothetical protein
MSVSDRPAILDRKHPNYRCTDVRVAGDAQSGAHWSLWTDNDNDLGVMRRLDEMFTQWRTSKPAPDHKIYPYLLHGLVIDRSNQVWVADITYLPIGEGDLQVVAIMDWASRPVLSWRLSNTMDCSICQGHSRPMGRLLQHDAARGQRWRVAHMPQLQQPKMMIARKRQRRRTAKPPIRIHFTFSTPTDSGLKRQSTSPRPCSMKGPFSRNRPWRIAAVVAAVLRSKRRINAWLQ